MSALRIWRESTLDAMGIMLLGLAHPRCHLNPSLRSNICLSQANLFLLQAETRPLVFLVEDLHWHDGGHISWQLHDDRSPLWRGGCRPVPFSYSVCRLLRGRSEQQIRRENQRGEYSQRERDDYPNKEGSAGSEDFAESCFSRHSNHVAGLSFSQH